MSEDSRRSSPVRLLQKPTGDNFRLNQAMNSSAKILFRALQSI